MSEIRNDEVGIFLARELQTILARTYEVSYSDIVYQNLEKQPYLSSPMFTNDDIGILSNLRSHTTRGIRSNFRQKEKC